MIEHPWVVREGALFTLRFPAKPDLEKVEAFGAASHAFYLENREPFAWVVDGSNVSFQTARLRKGLSEALERDRAHLSVYCAGMALVVPNAVVRGAAQAVLWLSPPDYAHQFFKEETRAREWAREKLKLATCEDPAL